MLYRKRYLAFIMTAIFTLSSLPIDASAQVSDYNVCNFTQAPLRTTDSDKYYDNLECEYTATGDYERWEDYRIAYISSSDYYEYYVYISADKVGSHLWLKLAEYDDDYDGVAFDVDLELYGPDGNFIDGSYEGENIAEYVSTTVTETGYYKVRVDRYSGSGDFKLERVLTENKGPTGNLFMYAPNDSLFMHEQISFDACDSYDVGGGNVYFEWFIDNSLQPTNSCELTTFIHDSQPHQICVNVEDYYEKEFRDCKTVTVIDPFSGESDVWHKTNFIDFDSENGISFWDKSEVYKAPGLDFWFQLGIRNDYKVETIGSWDIDTEHSWNDNTIHTTFSIENVDTKHNIYLRPSLTFEYYSSDMNAWQHVDIPLVSSEQVYSGQPSIELSGMELYYWNDFVNIADNAWLYEDFYDSNSFILADYVTLSEVDLYPLVRELLNYGTTGITGASSFLDFMEDWSEIQIPLSYDLSIGIAGVEYTGLLLEPIGGKVSTIEQMTSSGWSDYVEPEGTHIGDQIEIYEFGLTKISENSDLAEIGEVMSRKVIFSSFDESTDQVEFRIMQYSDIQIYNYQVPTINIGVESTFGNEYWTIAEFGESEAYTISRTASDTNMLMRVIRDSDGDGVKDLSDSCSDTPSDIVVLDDGCPESLIDRVLTGQGDMVPIYGISGGTLLTLIFLLVIVSRSGKKSKRNNKSGLTHNFGFEGTYESDFKSPPTYSAPPPMYHPVAAQFPDAIESTSESTLHENNQHVESRHLNEDAKSNGADQIYQNPPQIATRSLHGDRIKPPSFELKGEVDSDGYEWLESNGVWWWRNSPTNHWAIYKE